MTDALVIGAGPNGLAAAVALADAGHSVMVIEGAEEIGGGTRSAEMLEDGVLHDICSAVHPFGVASPFLRTLDLGAHGLKWKWPEVDLAHPLDDGTAGVMVRSLDQTVDALGPDGPRWRRTFEGLVNHFDEVVPDVLGPLLRIPDHPLRLARFGLQALQPATMLVRGWRTDQARALFAGIAAHSFQPLTHPTTAAAGIMLAGVGHSVGWPVAEGGSRAVTDALASMLLAKGGEISTGRSVKSLQELPPAAVTLLDVAPDAAIRIVGEQMQPRVRRALQRWKYGPGAFKLDLVLEGDIPWTNPDCARAGTVHCGGTLEEVVAAEASLHRNRMPERPFVLVGQQYLADPSRSSGNHNPIWVYSHVPHRYTGDATDATLAQIERFAPGFRDRIVGSVALSPEGFQQYNPNYVGGDISAGSNSPRQMLIRPRLALDPYRIADRVFLCSSATPPGAGVHGMCGFHAARSAMKVLAGA